jgi:hypothetical protein
VDHAVVTGPGLDPHRTGPPVSASTVGHLLHTLGYSLQGTAKTTEGISHPDRDAQFTHLNATAAAFLDDAQPVISVDTKAKEWLGNRDRPGRTWRPGKNAIKVDCHTFTTNDQPMAIPYGIYDIANNSGWVNVGTDHDTAQFAVESIRTLVATPRTGGPPQCHPAPDHRRLRRLQRPSPLDLEKQPGHLRTRERPGDHGLSPTAGDVEVEQDRAPDVLSHHRELAGAAADQLPGRP